MTRSQSNNQWSDGIVAHPTQKKFWVQKSAGKDLASICLGSKLHLPHWLSSKGPNYQCGVLLISAGAIEGYFEGKTPGEGHQGCLVLAWQCPGSSGRRTWPTWVSNVFITYSLLRIWPCRTTTCSLDWKKKTEWSPFFVRHGGYCCNGDLVGLTTFWIFFEWFAKVRATG